MRIGIDASPLGSKQRTGIGRCLHRILQVWSSISTDDEFYLISHLGVHVDFELPTNWHIVEYKLCTPHFAWYQVLYFYLPRIIKKYNLDVFWGTNYTLPYFLGKTKAFLSIYDLAIYKFPGIGEKSTQKKMNRFTPSSVQRANGIITISKATLEDIVAIFKTSKNKVFVNYIGGFSTKEKHFEGHQNVNMELIFDEPFCLFIGTIEPRKNLITLIKAFEEYKEKSHSTVKLILAGKEGWNCSPIYKKVLGSKYRQDIVMPGFISNQDKQYLLSNAAAFLFPSLYEGFGIPILEAMEYRLPVVTTQISSCPEVGGDAVYYLDDPNNSEQLSVLIDRVLNLSASEKSELNIKMVNQLKKFEGVDLEIELYNHIRSINRECNLDGK